ncbi:hypothetical protein [Carboxylicivirga linearis]|uniref:Uncharacterized protein n=1 Tax=Carboxylicivirga linearis TaxID=1628157 RepID=A0ABS5JUN2_9BACT|nr:hypothetical protein [Carboxylicivirga linearis]MBS2098066.1 hypothetical protein [Carboxylicivirga linearis]
MKSILVVALLSIASLSFAQNQNRVYGPKAKNEKVWINKSNKSEVVTNNNETVTGGKAKNNQVWAKNYNESETVKVSADENKMALKGPNAKNYKPYQKKTINLDEMLEQNLVENSDSTNQQNEILID